MDVLVWVLKNVAEVLQIMIISKSTLGLPVMGFFLSIGNDLILRWIELWDWLW
jgi:hypothetical protein